MMNKGQNKKAAPAKKVKRRIRPKIGIRTLTNYFVIPVATVIIVGIGVFIPAVLIKGRADPNKLPAGYVDFEYVQPYGAAYRLSEQSIVNAAHEYLLFEYDHYGQFDPDDYPSRDTAIYDQQYYQIGTQGTGDEFVYEFTTLMRDSFGGDDEAAVDWDVRDLSENVVLLGDLEAGEGYVLDRNSGVPILAEINIISSSDQCSVTQFFYDTIDMYNSYTGLDFSGEIDHSSNDGTYFAREILTSDNALSLRIEISCLDYYSYGMSSLGIPDGEYYYVWHVYIMLQSTEEPFFSMAVG